MTDRRLIPFSGRFALDSLRGRVEAEAFVAGEPARIGVALANLSLDRGAARDRQLLFGTEVLVIERRDEAAFVQSRPDGYCGWVAAGVLAAPVTVTHVVSARATHVYREASIKRGEAMALSLGARLAVLETEGSFARIAQGFVPGCALRPLAKPETDPVAVAERLLGTPYLWGGNSAFGIDCSGLVQLAHRLCALPCPADSDQQWQGFGTLLPEGAGPRRGDLVFWKGHVAMLCDSATIVHANGHSMNVMRENLAEALARIAASGTAPFLGMRRRVGQAGAILVDKEAQSL